QPEIFDSPSDLTQPPGSPRRRSLIRLAPVGQPVQPPGQSHLKALPHDGGGREQAKCDCLAALAGPETGSRLTALSPAPAGNQQASPTPCGASAVHRPGAFWEQMGYAEPYCKPCRTSWELPSSR